MQMRVLGTSISNRDECNKSKLSSFVSFFISEMIPSLSSLSTRFSRPSHHTSSAVWHVAISRLHHSIALLHPSCAALICRRPSLTTSRFRSSVSISGLTIGSFANPSSFNFCALCCKSLSARASARPICLSARSSACSRMRNVRLRTSSYGGLNARADAFAAARASASVSEKAACSSAKAATSAAAFAIFSSMDARIAARTAGSTSMECCVTASLASLAPASSDLAVSILSSMFLAFTRA
mmetsp:Transcript_7084/g.19339  ORF Transcript_7084/g.19339 Transcript_7084/m.19339 type:complete len:240 (+) Transcript_7084:1219-1938(+)